MCIIYNSKHNFAHCYMIAHGITCRNSSMHTVYVTGPAKIGHICTQNFALILKFNLQYLLKYKSYDNEIFMPYLQIN